MSKVKYLKFIIPSLITFNSSDLVTLNISWISKKSYLEERSVQKKSRFYILELLSVNSLTEIFLQMFRTIVFNTILKLYC